MTNQIHIDGVNYTSEQLRLLLAPFAITRAELWARVYAETLQAHNHIRAEEAAQFAVNAFDRRDRKPA